MSARSPGAKLDSMPATGEMEIFKQVLLTQMASVLASNRRLQTDLICTRYRMEEQTQEIDHARRDIAALCSAGLVMYTGARRNGRYRFIN